MKLNLKSILSALLILSIAFASVDCTRSKAKCKADAKRIKKSKVGWRN